jgi:hypothetical protein
MSATATATPRKWWQVYSGDKECRLFKELARGAHEWRTTDGLAKAAKVTVKDTEAICAKYVPLGIIQQHSKEPEKWRYWERATPKKKQGSVSDEDKKRRIDEKLLANKP